jgi:uncharacterized protein (DUF1015 family)
VAEVRPFAAVRYGEAAQGPLERLVAAPYDVIDDDARRELAARSPHNVVHLTLPASEREAASSWSSWLDEGVLAREPEPGFWALQQDYVGPDGVARTRTGLVGALRLEPYERGVVLPHERTHREVKEGRLRLLRAVRAQLEPIFLLHEGAPPLSAPERAPELEVEGARLWRLAADDATVAEAFAGRQLLIADGHHRYETALRFHEEERNEETAYVLSVLVSRDDAGLVILPTHRLAARVQGELDGAPPTGVQEALEELNRIPREQAAFVVVRRDGARLIQSEGASLDTAVVDELPLEGVTYTASASDAERAVVSGAAAAAFLVRPPTIEQVESFARAGQVMPPKSTYFFPKVTCGLLFSPFDE